MRRRAELLDPHSPDLAERLHCVQLMRDAESQIRSAPSTPTASLNPVFARLSVLSTDVKNRITYAQLAADRKRQETGDDTVRNLCGS